MNYLSILLVMSGMFLSTNVDQPSKIDFEKHTDVDREFVEFLSHFEKAKLPFGMDLEDIEYILGDNSPYIHEKNNLLIRHLNPTDSKISAFGRMGPPTIVPIKRFYPTKKTVAVSYVKKNKFSLATGSIFVAIFNLKGKLLSIKEEIIDGKRFKFSSEANFPISTTDFDQTQTFEISEDGLLQQFTFKRIWDKDYKIHGLENNEVVENRLIHEEIFQFREDGSMVSIHTFDHKKEATAGLIGRAE